MASKKAVSFADSVESGKTYKRSASDDIDDELLQEEKIKRRRPEKNERDDTEEEDEKKSKHTLDSDEEDEDKYEKMDVRKVEGQEDSTLDYDGNTKITAFNMKEDMEDGHFDADGNFIFDKKEKEIKDAWLDGIDWSHVKGKAGGQWKGDDEEEDEGDHPIAGLNDLRRKEIFTRLLDLLKPSQTVAIALQQLKKTKGMTAAEERKARWAAKKAGKAFEPDDSGKKTAELSTLADELLSGGHMDSYEWTRERVETLLGKLNVPKDDVDMFGDDPIEPSTAAGPSSSKDTPVDEDEVKWEYKEDGDADVEGPFTSQEMADKQDAGKIPKTALVRKVGQGSFNPALRIDFELYV